MSDTDQPENGAPPEIEGLKAWAAIILAANPDSLTALQAGLPVPRRQLRARSLELLGEPIVSKDDFVLTEENALALRLRADQLTATEDAALTTGEGLSLKLQTVHEFAAVDEASAEPILGNEGSTVLSSGGMMVFYGDGGAGKTTLELDCCFNLAAGQPWQGLQTFGQQRILIIENEGPRGMFRKKARAKLEHRGDQDLPIYILEDPWAVFSFHEEGYRDQLRQAILDNAIDIVAAGPVNRLGIQGGGTPEEVGAFILNIELIRQTLERPLAVIFAHHENKSGDVSGAWEGVPDTLAHIVNQGHGATTLKWQKVRWGPDLHGTTWKLIWRDGETFELDDRPIVTSDDELYERIDAYLTGHDWGSTTAISENVQGNASRLRDLLKTGSESGRYQTEKGPRGATMYALPQTSPYDSVLTLQDGQDGRVQEPHEYKGATPSSLQDGEQENEGLPVKSTTPSSSTSSPLRGRGRTGSEDGDDKTGDDPDRDIPF